MSAHTEDHTSRTEYVGLVGPLTDALRVLDDLERLADGRTVVAADEFAFLARRARGLVAAVLEFEHCRGDS